MSTPPAVPGYEVTGPLGFGGDGAVWSARDAGGTVVALRIVEVPDGGADPGWSARLERLRTVAHAGVAGVVDTVPLGGGTVAVVSRAVAGPSLAALRAGRRGLTAPEVVGVGAALASALVALHEAGVVHGDVAPANVVLEGEQVGPVLVDLVAGSAGTAGTWQFASPEVAAGGPPTPASDVYSLGAVLRWAAGEEHRGAVREVVAPMVADLPAARVTMRAALELLAAQPAEPVRLPDPALLAGASLREQAQRETTRRHETRRQAARREAKGRKAARGGAARRQAARGEAARGAAARREVRGRKADRGAAVRRQATRGAATRGAVSRGAGTGGQRTARHDARGRVRHRRSGASRGAFLALSALVAVLVVLGVARGTGALGPGPPDPGGATTTADPVTAVHELTAARDAALTSGDADALAALTVPGSAAAEADARLLESLRAAGVVLSGYHTTVGRARMVSEHAEGVTLEVVLTQEAHSRTVTAEGGSAVVHEVPARAPRCAALTLVPGGPAGWLVAQAGPCA